MNKINSSFNNLQKKTEININENALNKVKSSKQNDVNNISDTNNVSKINPELAKGLEIANLEEKTAGLLSEKLSQMIENTQISITKKQNEIISSLFN